MKNNALNHLAIIMDGNGRWAKEKNLPRIEGHKRGAEIARKVVEISIKQGIKHLSLYTFSSENWNRPILEIKSLMDLLEYYIGIEASRLHENGVKVVFIGNLLRLNPRLQVKIQEVMQLTNNNSILTLYVAVSYGGREELVEACRRIVREGLDSHEIDEDTFKRHLYFPEMPEVDLLIRTSGEQRISNFLLWHLAYSELYFIKKYWPDFSEEDLTEAIAEFNSRTRNFGYVRESKS
ncbi:MAG: uppS [Rickettsiaceae bacterium]|jgi:undecaprenyl diphosphate synthase|nr:uppS [Rickettsiaceae bacterium]